ncbi:contractile injection system protein, VgrG/Pvc8 family [Sphingomonas sp. HF-S3]|uniref:Contractile injection system protein, VgrG/Pvc8 family n=1 Tax=Sphingomonas rustica TaxID=3103142 RepID=A0ABV0BEJ3_9SPHN
MAAQDIPDFRVIVGGEDVSSGVRPRLKSLRISEKRGGEADQLDLVLDDSDGAMALPRKGMMVQVRLGWKQGRYASLGLVDKGSFKIDEVEWNDGEISLRGRSADQTSNFRIRKERSWRATTLGAIVGEIAAGNGWEARVAPELAAIAVPVLAQQQQSDMALLRKLGRDHDAVATVKQGALIFTPIGKGTTAGGTTLAGLTIRRSDGGRARYREIDRGVEARWHDRGSGTRKTVKAGTAAGKPKRLRRVYRSEADARAAANAKTGRTRRGAAECEVQLAYGRPDLYPERAVTLQGFKPEIDGKGWIAAEINHELDKRGLRNSVKLEADGPRKI